MAYLYDRVMRLTRKLGWGSGDWNTDDGVTVHWDLGGQTLCGRVHDAPPRYGVSRRGWTSSDSRWPVNCKHCLRKAAKERGDG